MRYSRSQLHKLSCNANTQHSCLVERVLPSHQFLRDRNSISNSSVGGNKHLSTSICTGPRSRPWLTHFARCRAPAVYHGRNQSTALAVDSSHFEDEKTGTKDEAQPYLGTFDEPEPCLAGIKALKDASVINHYELLNVHVFSSRMRKLFRRRGHVATFNCFPEWDDIVPILAEQLGVQHVLISKSHPYHRHCSLDGDFHVLINSKKQPAIAGSTSDSLATVLHDRVFINHVGHWLHDFRQNIEDRHPGVWRLLLHACRSSPLAFPRLEFVQHDGWSTNGLEGSVSGGQSHQLRLSNENYNILVVKCFDAGSDLSATFLHEAVLSYMEALCGAFPSYTDYSFRFAPGMWEPAEFLSRALGILGWGDIRFEETRMDDVEADLTAFDLWKVKIQTPNHGPLGSSIIWNNKKYARLVAIFNACGLMKGHLETAYQAGRLMPEEYQMFARYWAEKLPETKQVRPTTPDKLTPANYKIMVNEDIVSNMLESLRTLMQVGFQSTYEWSSSKSADLEAEPHKHIGLTKNPKIDRRLYREHSNKAKDVKSSSLVLPVRQDRICSSIQEAVNGSAITIITAATGSGKTTQIPQIIFDQYIANGNGSMCNIVCTQPRRVSTISVATRVASERHQQIGRQVGYKVRFDLRPTETTCGITYMTSGYLLRMLEADPVSILHRHSHIVLDEVHARDVDTDLILTALKNILGKRVLLRISNMPKIILMSATINAGFFRRYFEDLGPDVKVATVDVPGTMYPVEKKNLDHVLTDLRETHSHQLDTLLRIPELKRFVGDQSNSGLNSQNDTNGNNPAIDVNEDLRVDEVPSGTKDLFVPIPLLHLMIVRLLSTTTSGDILVFLPGLGEIDSLEELLQKSVWSQAEFSDFEKHRIFKLHSALYHTNFDVFKDIPPGCRRIVLATNIAETSITLPSVRFVIDTGLSRQNTFDQVTQSGTFGLQWISKAEVMQRKGRAGRTHAGIYHAIYSQAQYDAMPDAPTPEILRTSLDHLVLRSSSSPAFHLHESHVPKAEGAEDVLAGQALLTSPSPPEVSYVAAAASQVHNIRALSTEGETTAMGKVLSRLPMSPAAAKAVLLGTIFRCLDTLLIFGAFREDSPLMFDPVGIGGIVEKRRQLSGPTDDDKWADSRAFFLYDTLRRQGRSADSFQLKEELSIRHDAYCEYAQISKQSFDTLRPMLGLYEDDGFFDGEPDLPKPLFPLTPRSLNVNSANATLAKALALSTAGTRFACWNHKNWRAQYHQRVLPHPKSVNHNGSRRLILVQRLRHEDGDLLSYGTMRTIPKDKYPWLHETSAVTPLMAILFGESVSLLKEEAAFIINGWVTYRLTPGTPTQDVKRAAKIIWEYRKALDRFIAHAMQMVSLEPHKLSRVRKGDLTVDDFNIFFKEKENQFRKIFVDSVIKILEIDGKDRDHRAVIRALEVYGDKAAMARDIPKNIDPESLIKSLVGTVNNYKVRDTLKVKDPQEGTQVVSDGAPAGEENGMKDFLKSLVQ